MAEFNNIVYCYFLKTVGLQKKKIISASSKLFHAFFDSGLGFFDNKEDSLRTYLINSKK